MFLLLQISDEVKADIRNAVNAGKNVVIPQRNIIYYSWTGTGYIVVDPITGAGAYMISTNLAGGGQCIAAGGMPVILLSIIGASGGGSHQCTALNIEHNVVVHSLQLILTVVAPLNIGALFIWIGLTNQLMGLALGLALGAQIALIGLGIILIAIALYHAYLLYNAFINTAAIQSNGRLFARRLNGARCDA